MALKIEATEDTPYVELDEQGSIHIEGRSLPENVSLFYKPIFEWVKEYVKSPAGFTSVTIFLNYYNSSSFKCISDVLYQIATIQKDDNIKVKWIYEEDDQSIYETGVELKEELKIPFELIQKPVVKEKKEKIVVKNKKTQKTYQITREYWNLIVRNGHEKDFELIQNDSK
jgi:hypothetical protein